VHAASSAHECRWTFSENNSKQLIVQCLYHTRHFLKCFTSINSLFCLSSSFKHLYYTKYQFGHHAKFWKQRGMTLFQTSKYSRPGEGDLGDFLMQAFNLHRRRNWGQEKVWLGYGDTSQRCNLGFPTLTLGSLGYAKSLTQKCGVG
jgi:hypothetical protein